MVKLLWLSFDEVHQEEYELIAKVVTDYFPQTDRLAEQETRVGRKRGYQDEEKMKQLANHYGLSPDFSPSPNKLSHPSQPSHSGIESGCEGFCEGSPVAEKPSRDFEANCEGCDRSEGFQKGTEGKIGMSTDQVLEVWESAGKPAIQICPGENCLTLRRSTGTRGTTVTLFSNKFIHVRKYRQSFIQNLSQPVQMSQ